MYRFIYQGVLFAYLSAGLTAAHPLVQENPTSPSAITNPQGAPYLDADGVSNVRSFGALGDGQHDDSSSFLAAAKASAALNHGPAIVYLPCGHYAVHEVDLTSFAADIFVFSPGTHCGQLLYDGKGGPDSYVLRLGAMSSGGLQGLSIYGFNQYAPSGVASNLLQIGWFVDEMAIFRDLSLAESLSDAIILTSTVPGYVNFHLSHLRFDAIGGYALHLRGSKVMEARPFSMSDWTWDNAASAPGFQRALRGLGLLSSTEWGRGILFLDDCAGMEVVLRDGRIETNYLLAQDPEGGHSILFESSTPEASGCSVTVESVAGFGSKEPKPYLLSSADGAVNLTVRDSNLRSLVDTELVRSRPDDRQSRSPLVSAINPDNAIASKSCKEGNMTWEKHPRVNAPVGWVCTASGDTTSWHPFGRIER